MSKQKMVTAVENNIVDGLSDVISVEQINKHYSECSDCVHANMAQKSHPKKSERIYDIGKTLAIDVFEPGSETLQTMQNGKKNSAIILTHTGERYAVICKDRGSGRTWVFLTATLSRLLEFIKRMDRIYSLANHNLEEIQIDEQFYTADIKTYIDERKITPSVTAPYEHAQNGAAEITVKIFKEGIMK